MARSIVIGDVHGCAIELDGLLDKLALASDDRLYFVGDLVAKGPESRRVLTLARKLGAKVARVCDGVGPQALQPRPEGPRPRRLSFLTGT